VNGWDVGLKAAAAGCPRLQHLDLTSWKVTDGGLEAVAAGCPKLHHLYLECCTDAGAALFPNAYAL